MKLRPYSLAWRLVPLVLVLHLAFFGLLAMQAIRDLRHLVVEQVGLRSDGLAAELSAALTAPMLERDYVTLAEIARDLTAATDIEYLVIFDNADREMARAGLGADARLPFVEADVARATGEVFDFAVPLAQGRAQAGLRMTGMRALLDRYAGSAALWTLVAATLAGLSMVWVVLWLTRRLARLEETVEAVGRGDLSARAAEDLQGDEISRLAAAFNHMAEDVRHQIESLRLAEEATLAALQETREEHARLATLLASMKLGILFVDRDSRVLYANPALRRIWLIPPETTLNGLLAEHALSLSANSLAQPDHFSRLVLKINGTQETSDSTELEVTDGRVISQLCHPVRDEDERLVGRLWVFEDITQDKRSAEQLIYLAERDGLTGLFNRRRFEQAMERALAETGRHGKRLALLFFDLDEFKHLNDHFGHRAGDALLVRVANELTAVVRKNEILARLGGDEFAVLATDIAGADEVRGLAERIVRAVARIPLSFDGQNLRVTASLGVAMYPEHADTLAGLVVCADKAMYRAKAEGKNGWRIYDGQGDDICIDRLTWSERIHDALEHDRLMLHYQGIHDSNGRLLHVEALMRMSDRDRAGTIIGPNHFIPHAEKIGSILALDRWALAAAIAQLARLPGLPGIAVNISARSLADTDLPKRILAMLDMHAVAPHRLLIEITETAALGDLQQARYFLDILQPAGCRVCLDDFGTGFSSFAYLKHINADILKIDGQFVRDLAGNRDNQIVVRAIVDIARGMGKRTVAECVEDAATHEILRDFGVDAMQGYHLSLPCPDAAVFLDGPACPGIQGTAA